MKNSIPIRKIIFSLLLALTFFKTYSQNVPFDSLASEISRIAIVNKTKSLEMLNDLYQMAYNAPDSSLRIAHCLYEESILKYCHKIVDTLLLNRIRKQLDRKHLSDLEHALLQSAFGINLTLEGKYADAFSIHLQALETFKHLKQNRFIGSTLNSLGNICVSINLLNLAEYYYSEACAYTIPDSYRYYFAKLNIFLLLSYSDKEAAVDSLLRLIEVAKEKNIEELLPVLYINIGSCLLDTLPEKALTCFSKMQTLNFDNPSMMGTLYANMGSYYLYKKHYAKALSYFKDAQKIMEHNKNFLNLPHLYDDISSVFEKQNRCDSALFYSKKSKALTLQLHSNLVAIETHQQYITTLLEVSKNKLTIAEQTIKLKNKQFIIITIITAFTVLLILLLLLLTHQQKLRKASENRELTAKLEHEKRVQQYEKRQRRLEKEKQEAIIDAKTREITSYSMLVSNKNRMLKQIGDLNIQIFDNKENATKTAKKIDEIIQHNLNIDDEWENFKMHFDKVHPHFFEKLRQHCDYLTEENLKMCAYIKMRMTTKQIAQLLHVIPNSIITNRYRIKKKLSLADFEDLDSFIESL